MHALSWDLPVIELFIISGMKANSPLWNTDILIAFIPEGTTSVKISTRGIAEVNYTV